MASYDFNNILSPLDFEYLAKDVLSRDLGVELTSFAEGKDKGVDLRYSKNGDRSIIVQCKRKNKIDFKELEAEKDKIEKLNPDKYFLVISNDLSPVMMDRIRELFKKWMSGDECIYTKSRINDLLNLHSDIERKHYKLWLNSSTVFGDIINQDLYERAKSLINDIARSYKYYVKNPSFDKAVEILNGHRFLIISGVPGIGKTTLAKLLLWEYLQENYEIIEIKKVSDGERVLIEESDSKQVFYFDDFLGENFLKYDVIEGRSYDLLQFINRVINNKNKILIMTTREYILTQAKERYEKLNTDELNLYKYTLDLDTYTKRIRAQILYNHLYYSEIPIDYIQSLITKKTYKRIINHKNYSPRIIEHMTVKLSNATPEDYPSLFINSLNFPYSIWDRAFNSQITDGAKYTLYLLLSIGNQILLSEFHNAFEHYYKNIAKNGIQISPLDLKDYLRELEGCFISIRITSASNHVIEFQNPSIKDFLLPNVTNDLKLIRLLLNSSLYFSQFIYTLNYIAKDFHNDASLVKEVDSIIINRFDKFIENTRVIGDLQLGARKDTDIEKIDQLSNYVQNSAGDTLVGFIVSKYRDIDVAKLESYNWGKYITFYENFKEVVRIKFSDLLNRLFYSINWFSDLKNFIRLKQVAPSYFSRFINAKQDELKEITISVIRKDFEMTDDKDDLQDLIDDIDDEIASLGIVEQYQLDEVSSEISDKISEIENKTPEEYDDDHRLESSSDAVTDDIFNEDDLFRIELFDR
ncbi:restriction endonuclease [uncultured Alistipes sp.]|jgi:hypothetical protein|uniref:nSTAND3 domain-containing NTPase n=1 Tax=uncultured Alistipes sp. TaxID=538949 RepID=UPI0025E3AA7A|nr:restriction endonuclease [uncultured Alistipes sp.]